MQPMSLPFSCFADSHPCNLFSASNRFIREFLIMFRWRNFLTAALLLAFCAAPSHAVRFHRKPTSGHGRSKKAARHMVHGQQVIDADRSRQIQTALIREHYLDGEPNGVWDDRSKQAMLKYQADNGWQTKVTPDSRALIKLGLGPSATAADVAATSHPAGAPAASAAPTPAAPPSHTLGSAISAHSSQSNNFLP